MSGNYTGSGCSPKYLFTPGPVPLGTETALASARPMISHRGSDFHDLYSGIQAKLGTLLGSSGPFILFPSSGTGALEALAANLTGPGAKVLSVSCGVFGDRFREIVSAFGSYAAGLDIAPGSGAGPEEVARALRDNPGTDVLLLTQNETSTGVLNPIREIIESIPIGKRPLVLVDGVSSVGAMPCYPEEWGIDGLAFASQKGLLTPPGLGFVWLSERGWEAACRKKVPSYYFDLAMHRKYLRKHAEKLENPYTPPISLYFALDSALDSILSAEGHFESRVRAARSFAAGLESLGFELLVRDEKFRSPGVTAFSLPGGDTASVSSGLKALGVEPAGGQGSLAGKIIRMAHYHDFGWPEISLVLGSLYAAMGERRLDAGDFTAAAHGVFFNFVNNG